MVAAGLIASIVLWGANNVGVRHLVQHWPPLFTASTRMFCVTAILFALLRVTDWFGRRHVPDAGLRRHLWFGPGVWLALYVAVFTWGLCFTTASRIALTLATSPIWGAVYEGRPRWNAACARRYGAALLALAGVWVLVWPALGGAGGDWRGDLLGLAASFLWVGYSRQCKELGQTLSGVEITAHTMWRAAVWLGPLAIWEIWDRPLPLTTGLLVTQSYCVVFGGVIAFTLHYHGLRCWPASRVFLFGNLLPVTTMAWSWLLLREGVTREFWVATALVVAGVVLGTGRRRKQ